MILRKLPNYSKPILIVLQFVVICFLLLTVIGYNSSLKKSESERDFYKSELDMISENSKETFESLECIKKIELFELEGNKDKFVYEKDILSCFSQ